MVTNIMKSTLPWLHPFRRNSSPSPIQAMSQWLCKWCPSTFTRTRTASSLFFRTGQPAVLLSTCTHTQRGRPCSWIVDERVNRFKMEGLSEGCIWTTVTGTRSEVIDRQYCVCVSSERLAADVRVVCCSGTYNCLQ